ncbi:hypothetical protein DPMN_111054 [Dreissena polymorpha]|uniref:Uncharacterized protein n=1 Tax=Dreissena polymorpha TaxID=45954 RepID=A0A9D4KDT8_DREPO|nr:hypothetical protein DPMN_111054 [Dreissena polymorpha]
MADKSHIQNDQNVDMSLSEEVDPTPVEQPERKITQTDHLNKKLLSAFLDQINNIEAENPDRKLEEAQGEGSKDEWEDKQ